MNQNLDFKNSFNFQINDNLEINTNFIINTQNQYLDFIPFGLEIILK